MYTIWTDGLITFVPQTDLFQRLGIPRRVSPVASADGCQVTDASPVTYDNVVSRYRTVVRLVSK